MSSLSRQLGKMLRETGQALNVLGVVAQDQIHHLDHFSRHRKTMPLGSSAPNVASDSWVAPSASLIGNVTVGRDASVWYGAVVRADEGAVHIGERSNVQDDAVIAGSRGARIGKGVTVGHGAIIKNSNVDDGSLIGIRAVLNGAKVGSKSIVAAGAVLSPGTEVKSGELWAGNPAVLRRTLSSEEKAFLDKSANDYCALARVHAK